MIHIGFDISVPTALTIIGAAVYLAFLIGFSLGRNAK